MVRALTGSLPLTLTDVSDSQLPHLTQMRRTHQMKISRFRKSLLSAGSGALLALAVGLFAISFTAPVRAGDDPPIVPVEEGGIWTCPPAPGGCGYHGYFV